MTKPKRTPEEVSEVMRKVHSYDTSPEIALQTVLREQGVEYEVHPADLPGQTGYRTDQRSSCCFCRRRVLARA